MGVREQYEAKKAADQRRAEERKPTPWWWLGQRDPIARFSKWLVIYTFFLFVATVGSAVVLLITDHTFNDQLKAMQGQLDEMREASKQTRQQLAIAESEQRPWITVAQAARTPYF